MEEFIVLSQISKKFILKKKVVQALNGVNLALQRGKTTALVGESGCGKSTIAKILTSIYLPDSGKILLNNQKQFKTKDYRKYVQKHISLIFQNPYASFDPRYTIFQTLEEVYSIQRIGTEDKMKYFQNLLEMVGLNKTYLNRYPMQLSGGELQRIALARALIKKPTYLILDEPTSSLDVSTAVKIVELLKQLQQRLNIGYLFISHDIRLVKKIAHFIAVMYQGYILEYGPAEEIYLNPLHQYTKILIKAAEYKLTNYRQPEFTEKGCPWYGDCVSRKGYCRKLVLNQGNKVYLKEHWAYCSLNLKGNETD